MNSTRTETRQLATKAPTTSKATRGRQPRRASPRTLLAVALGLSLPCVADAAQAETQRTDVMTHRSQGDVTLANPSGARLARSPEGVFVTLVAKDLKPGHAYTMWVVAINAPENCSDAPCPSTDVMQNTDVVQADLGFGDGAVAGKDGRVRFAAFQPMGAMPHSWFGRGLTDTAAEIHLVVRDHGPLVPGREAAMLGTFREGCNAESVADTLPATARGDGVPGSYKCANVQAAIFQPVE